MAYYDQGAVWVDSSHYYFDWDFEGIWVLDPETGNSWLAVPNGRYPTWSPSGLELALSISGQIYTSLVDGSGLTPIPRTDYGVQPDWKPDWTRMAWAVMSGAQSGVWSVNLDGTTLEHHLRYASDPDWHPTEDLILCDAWIGDLHGIVEVNPWVHGGDPQFVKMSDPDSRVFCGNATYSPDGEYIAFERQRWGGGELPQIWVMNRDGTSARQLTRHGGVDPAWSPDGTRIVYTRRNWRSNALSVGVLWVVDVITGEHTQLTHKRVAADALPT